MIRLCLFARSQPDRLLAEREIEVGAVVVGRGEDADWVLDDPERLLSRRHCLISVADGLVSLTDLSANGVFLDGSTERCARGPILPLRVGQTLQLGDYLILVAQSEQEDQPAPNSSVSCSETTRSQATDHGALLEAFFCAAHLDVSTFADEDPAAIMQRLGGIYRETVVGLAELMSERSAAKADYVADHTTVSNVDNNPFRWAAPQRLAVDLLRKDREGFMTGPDAVKASFGDVRRHSLCFAAGMRAALQATRDLLSPKAVETHLRGKSQLLGHKAAAWTEYTLMHDQVQREANENPSGAVNLEFRKGYEACLRALESGAPRKDA
jgi:predicted component of type VI protein secretion system